MKSANSSSCEGASSRPEPPESGDPGAASSAGFCAPSCRHSMLFRA